MLAVSGVRGSGQRVACGRRDGGGGAGHAKRGTYGMCSCSFGERREGVGRGSQGRSMCLGGEQVGPWGLELQG
jgi:hypothetical protein